MYLKKNIKFLRERHGKMTQGNLAKIIGKSRSAISSYEDGRAEPDVNTLAAVATHFNVTIDQLVKTDLRLLEVKQIHKQQELKKYVSAENLRILTVTVDKEGKETTVLVPEKASAGYTLGYGDETYIQELPSFYFPFLDKEKTFRAFEIEGDSMLPIKPGMVVIGEYVENFDTIKDGQVCILVSREAGIVLKKVFKTTAGKDKLLLKSNNLAYAPYEIEAGSIIEIWKFTAFYAKEFPEETNTSAQDLKEAFWRIEDEVRKIKNEKNIL